jgi:hypothetical protein
MALPGTMRTNLADNTVLGKTPLPPDYQGSLGDQTMRVMTSGTFRPNSDPVKIAKLLFDVVTAEGAGKGHENEILIPLGVDGVARMELMRDRMMHAVEVFGEAAKAVQWTE